MMIRNLNRYKTQAIKCIRCYSESSFQAKFLQYCEFGEPLEVLGLSEATLCPPAKTEVLVKVLAAPINPSDVNTIQGKYPIKPKKFPAIAGNEFVAEVVCVGDDVKSLCKGDRVVTAKNALGTWTTLGVYEETSLMKIPKTIGIAEAATLTVNPCTAYRLLKDFVKLKPGDVVVQNGANSAVGQAVHQLCRAWQICSVGIVRCRPDIDELKKELENLGATKILTEEEAKNTKLFKDEMPKPKLALNCVGGKSSMLLARFLDKKGKLVTYGGMSMQPVMVGTGPFIFLDIACCGFWVTRWMEEHCGSEERQQMFCELIELIEKCALKAPQHTLVPLADFKKGAAGALCLKKDGFSGKKILLDMIC